MDGLRYTDFHDARKFLTEFVHISNTEFQPNWIKKNRNYTQKSLNPQEE
jgi:hypothetical protein